MRLLNEVVERDYRIRKSIMPNSLKYFWSGFLYSFPSHSLQEFAVRFPSRIRIFFKLVKDYLVLKLRSRIFFAGSTRSISLDTVIQQKILELTSHSFKTGRSFKD